MKASESESVENETLLRRKKLAGIKMAGGAGAKTCREGPARKLEDDKRTILVPV